MKAIVWTKYGPPEVLALQDVATPIPQADQVLVRIHATTVTKGDCELRNLSLPIYFALPLRLYFGFRKPKPFTIPGTEFAGEIQAVGSRVTRFRAGDRVCGSSAFAFGAYAEYICLSQEPGEGVLSAIPANLTFSQAVTVPFGGLEALYFLKKGSIQGGQQVLVIGAGGSIGTYAVQLAKFFGASVTAVDSAAKLGMLRAHGADHVIDYTQVDFTASGELYDVIFDAVGKNSLGSALKALKPGGTFLLANPGASQVLERLWAGKAKRKKVVIGTVKRTTDDLVFLLDLVATGKLEPVIDRQYTLEQIPEAHRYVESGAKKGNVVITVAQDNNV